MSLPDRVVVLDRGKPIAESTLQEVVANPRVVTAYLGTTAGAGMIGNCVRIISRTYSYCLDSDRHVRGPDDGLTWWHECSSRQPRSGYSRVTPPYTNQPGWVTPAVGLLPFHQSILVGLLPFQQLRSGYSGLLPFHQATPVGVTPRGWGTPRDPVARLQACKGFSDEARWRLSACYGSGKSR